MVVALTDVRLVLGERLGPAHRRGRRGAGRPARRRRTRTTRPTLLAAYYDFMTWLQESLTQALMA